MVAAILEQQNDKGDEQRHSTEGPNAKTRDEDRPENGGNRQPSELEDIREQPNRQAIAKPTHLQPAANSATSNSSESHTLPNNCQTAPSANLGEPNPPDSGEHIPIVRLRQKPNRGAAKTKPAMQLPGNDDGSVVNGDENHTQNGTHGEMAPINGELSGSMAMGNGNDVTPSSAAALLHRTMEALYESNPGLEDNTEEIRRLDSQLDHLNEYMDKVEERLKSHNEKLMETLRQQKEDREKRRRSFHERLEASRQEDDDFQRQLSQILNKVDISLKRQSISEFPISHQCGQSAENPGENASNDVKPEQSNS